MVIYRMAGGGGDKRGRPAEVMPPGKRGTRFSTPGTTETIIRHFLFAAEGSRKDAREVLSGNAL